METVPKTKRFRIIQEMSTRFTVRLLCSLANVSSAGYYKWVKRQTILTEKQESDERIKSKLLEGYNKNKGIYGYRRMKIWLKKKYGIHINHKRVQRLMRDLGIKSVIRKKRPYYGKKEPYVLSENHLNREFQAEKANQKWVTDITCLIFNGQRLYLSVIMDLYNNEVIAYHVSSRNDLKLVIDTLKKARSKRDVKGVLLHSDQGYQYTSRQYNQLLTKYRIEASMSRKANCWDNACIESFFSHFKSECFRLYSFKSSKKVKDAVKKYMYFYNHQRFQKKLNNQSPYEFRTLAA